MPDFDQIDTNIEDDDSQPDFGQKIEDFGSLLQRQNEELENSKSTIKDLHTDLEGTRSVIDKLRGVFSPDGEKLSESQKRIQSFEALASKLDRAALEDQKRGGKGLPLTTEIGKHLSDFARSTLLENEKLRQELNDIKTKVDTQGNPAFQNLQRITFAADNMVGEALDSLYGNDPDASQVKQFQQESVNNMIKAEIRQMIEENNIADIKKLNNPKAVRSMVNHFMAKVIPPKVRQMMDNERIMNEPDDPRQLMASLREANQRLAKAREDGDGRNEEFYSNVVTEIREKFLAATKGQGASINKIIGGIL